MVAEYYTSSCPSAVKNLYLPMALRISTILFLFFSLLACASQPATITTTAPAAAAQEAALAKLSWKKILKAAQAAEAAGETSKAAALYRAVWDKNPKKVAYLHTSAELYANMNDYRRAADAYQFLLPYSDAYPLAGLKLGRLLKQDGQYDRAQRSLARFLEGYNESDRPIIEELVAVELAGTELAQQQAGRSGGLTITRPTKGINSEADEYSPIPVDLGQLYFSSNRGGQGRLYESRQQGRDWSNASAPQGFPIIAEGQYGGGSISPDGQRFYFTICSGLPDKDANTRCEIFLSQRNGSGWSQPTALPEYINSNGTNNLDPHAAIINGREILYFSSNREGGRGGLDIWYVARNLGLTSGDFSYPTNLGPTINTLADERSAYYHNEELALYFSSNGHPSLGGMDIFKASGQEINWARPENLGIPINSPANDFGFVVDRKGDGNAYLSSNRPFGGIKNNTTETDIFQVNLQAGMIRLKATAYDNQAGVQLDNILVTLYQIYPDGAEERLVQKNFPSGTYLFELIPNQRFRVEVSKAGYQAANYTFTTNQEGVTTYGQPLFLLPAATKAPDATNTTNYPDPGTTTPTYPSAGSYPSTDPPSVPNSDSSPSPTTGQPALDQRPSGRYYKIQISAVQNFDPNAGQYQAISAFGDITTEDISSSSLQRVMVGPYTSDNSARQALSEIQRNGFPAAFVVRYDDGVRYGRINL